MSGIIIPKETSHNYDDVASEQKSLMVRFFRQVVFSHLNKITRGRIVIRDNDGEFIFGDRTPDCKMKAVVTVRHPSFYRRVVFDGTIGSGEAYMEKSWDCDELAMLIRIVISNEDVLQNLDSGLSRLTSPLNKLFHFRRRNTRKGSKKNIAAHYDLGNDFYRLFLDETMAYSCAFFAREDMRLREASIAKFDRICTKLDLHPDDHLLEIGTGWGGFALHAVKNYGCRMTTTTISKKQYEMAQHLFEKEGVADRIELLQEDYRDLAGSFDKIVSIEMIEAVGHRYFNRFFECCSNLLKDNGMMLLQAITIKDQVFEMHKKEVDFIKRYIFQGSCIPSITSIVNAVASSADMKLYHMEDITSHYVKTLRAWRQKFFKNVVKVKEMGYPESFIRMWEFYLCYCEGGFEERYLGDVQMLFAKPGHRKKVIIPT